MGNISSKQAPATAITGDSRPGDRAAACARLAIRLETLPVCLDLSRPGDPEAKQLLSPPYPELFPDARSPRGAAAGLLLIAGCWEEAHQVAQDLASPEGSYWHALAHRMEHDTANSNYWFHQTGSHAIFTDLFQAASELIGQDPRAGVGLGSQWDPPRFNAWCDRARGSKDPELTSLVTQIHTAECWLLWRWCARLSQK
jgi:hypothetical protein